MTRDALVAPRSARQNRPTHTWAEGGRGAHSGPVGHDVLMSTSTASQLATARSGSTSNALTLVPCSARQPTMRNTEGRSRAQFASANLDGSAGSSEAAASELHKAAVGRRDGRLAQGAPRRMQSSLTTRMLDAAQRAGAIAPGPAAMTMCDALVASRVSGTSSNSAPAAAKSWEQQRCRETRRGPHVAGHRASVSVCDVCGMRRGARRGRRHRA